MNLQERVNNIILSYKPNEAAEAIAKLLEEEAIAFLDSIREYEHESGNKVWLDERTSREFYTLFKQ